MSWITDLIANPDRQILLGSFIAIIGTSLAALGAYRSASQRADWEHSLRQKNEALLSKSEELASSQIRFENQLRQRSDENAELNRQLAQKSDAISELNRQIASSIIGGDSFCYLDLYELQSGSPFIMLIHMGEYPLYDLNIRIADLNVFEEEVRRAEGGPLTWHAFRKGDQLLRVGNLAKGNLTIKDDVRLPLSDKGQQGFNIFFSARNGMWTQILRLRLVHHKWTRAYKVVREAGGKTQVLRQFVDDEFPKDANGEPDWR